MTKLCPRGKAAAKRKFAVYPSAYANAYASKICAGKIKDPSGTKRKDFKGPKPAGKAMGGRINKIRSDQMRRENTRNFTPGAVRSGLLKSSKSGDAPKKGKGRKKMMGGGMIDMTRMKYLKGGQV